MIIINIQACYNIFHLEKTSLTLHSPSFIHPWIQQVFFVLFLFFFFNFLVTVGIIEVKKTDEKPCFQSFYSSRGNQIIKE